MSHPHEPPFPLPEGTPLVGGLDTTRAARLVVSRILWVLLFALLFLPIALRVGDYGFWRHDSMHYLDTYRGKFATEGRWLNNALHEWLVQIPPFASWFLTFAALSLFFLQVSRKLFERDSQRLLVTVICMACTTWYSQLNWPYYGLTSALLLLAAALLAELASIWVLLPMVSVLMFGGLSIYIYLLPLIYLFKVLGAPDSRATLAWLGRILSAWALGFVLGYGVASLATWLAFGHGIQAEDWRRPHQATELSQLLSNLSRNGAAFADHLSAVAPNWTWALAGIALASALLRSRSQTGSPVLPRIACALAICLCIAVSHHVLTVPAGIMIQHRSLPQVYLGVVFGALSLVATLRPPALVIGLLLVLVAVPSWLDSYRNVVWFADQTQAMRESVAHALPGAVPVDKGFVIVDARHFQPYYARVTGMITEPPRRYFETMAADYRFERALTEEGFERTVFCPSSGGVEPLGCDRVYRVPTPPQCLHESTTICVLGTTVQGALIIRLQP